MKLPDGTIIEDRYKIIGHLGVGGMGSVYEAEQLDLQRTVAIKFLSDPEMAQEEAFARFKQEAQIISSLCHKNIVAVYACGTWENHPYMVMECIKGTSLQKLLQPNEPLDQKLVFDIVRQICAGLSAAHGIGVVHRDIKPSNIIIGEGGVAKIIDFGFAKVVARGAPKQDLTEAGAAVGSVLYMSPEQCQGMPVDRRSDIYALGCVMHHCLTGVPPFSGEHSVVVMMQHLKESPQRLVLLRSDLTNPESVQAIVDTATAKAPDSRYQTAEELSGDVDKAEKGGKIVSSVKVAPSTDSERRSATRNKVLFVAVVATLMLPFAWVAFRNAAPPPVQDDLGNSDRRELLRQKIADMRSIDPKDKDKFASANVQVALLALECLSLNNSAEMRDVASSCTLTAIDSATDPEKCRVIKKLHPVLFQQPTFTDAAIAVLTDTEARLRKAQWEKKADETHREIEELNLKRPARILDAARARIHFAMAIGQKGENQHAIEEALIARKLYMEASNPPAEEIITTYGTVFWHSIAKRQYEEALQCAKDSLALVKRYNFPAVDEENALAQIGIGYMILDNFKEALKYLHQAELLLDKPGPKLDVTPRMLVLGNLAQIYDRMGDKENAKLYYDRWDRYADDPIALEQRSDLCEAAHRRTAEYRAGTIQYRGPN